MIAVHDQVDDRWQNGRFDGAVIHVSASYNVASFKPQRLQGFLCAEGNLVRIAGQATVCLKESLLQISSPFWRCFKYKLESLQGILQSLVAVEDCKQYNRFKLRLHCCW